MANPSLGTAVLRTRLDQTGLTSGLNTARQEAGRTLDTLDRRFEQTGQKLQRLGTGLTIGLTAPLTALGAVSVRAASDAEETAAKFETVFRDIGDSAQAAADRLVESYGQSDRAAQGLLANTGDLLTGFGFSQQAALDLSTQVNELAVDLASFTNFSGGAEGASAALTSALLGEREAAKSLGIAITEDVVQAKLDELRATGQLIGETERQQEAYATLLIAQEQSANAIGDFARTQDSYANQTRILAAEVDNLKVALGEGLLPILTPVVSGLAGVAGGFADMNDATRNAVLIIGGGAAASGPLLLGIGKMVELLPRLRTGLIQVRTVMGTMFGPAGIVAAGAIAFGTLAARTLQATNALNEYANMGVQVQGLSEEAAGLMEAALALEAARGEFVERQNARLEAGEVTGEEAQAAIDRYDARIQGLRDRFGEAVREAAALREEATQLGNLNLGEIALPDLGGGRSVEGVFADLATAGTIANRRAEALGGTVEDRLASVETRAGLVSNAIDELFELGLTATDAKVQYLVGRLETLQSEAERLQAILEPGGLSGRLARDGDGGLSRIPTGPEFPMRLARTGDGGLAEAVRIQNTQELAEAIRIRMDQDARPGVNEARRAFMSPGMVAVLDVLQSGRGASGVSDDAISEGELLARQAELSFDEYLASMPNAATDLSLSAEELTRAAARLTLAPRQEAVLGVLGRAQATAIATGRQSGGYGAAGDLAGRPVNFPTAVDRFEDPLAGPSSLDSRGKFVFSGLDENIGQAGEEFAQRQADSAKEFAETIIGAGQGFVGAISQFQAGNIGGGIASLAGAAGGIANFFAPGIGSLISGAGGLLGGIINLFGGGGDQGQAEADSARRAKNLTTLELNFRFDQSNTFNGGMADPANEQALNRQADMVFAKVEELFRRSILPDIRALKERTGLA